MSAVTHNVRITTDDVFFDAYCETCRDRLTCAIADIDDGARWVARHVGVPDVRRPFVGIVLADDWGEVAAAHAESIAVADGFELAGGV